MKKLTSLKLMLLAVVGLFGISMASAQTPTEITFGNFKYTVLTWKTDAKTATVQLDEVINEADLVDASGVMQLPGNFNYAYGSDTYKVSVTKINATKLPLKNHADALSVTIPKEITEIPSNCFYGCTYMNAITFETGSKVETIGTHAFATTQISKFDFSPCDELAGLPNEVFVEENLTNTFITEVTVPSTPLFKHVNGAFQNLKKLKEIKNLENSYIQEVIAKAFDGCDELKKLRLPGNNLQYIDALALEGSKVNELSINVSKLVSLGGGTVNTSTYLFAASAKTVNLYNQNAVGKTPLTKLTLTGTLTGKICKNAFSWCDGIDEVLDLTGMTFGTTAQIEGEAFATCLSSDKKKGIKGVKIGNITDNQSGDYTIAADAFKGCDLLATVEIGDITTAKAIGKAAFHNLLKTVTIGTVKADDEVFATGAFVWKDVKDAALNLASETSKYLNANNVTKKIIAEGAFDISALSTNAIAIKIGEIKSKGGVFTNKAFTDGKIASLTFTGDIAATGIDVDPFTADGGLTAITFKGAIAKAGVKALTSLTKLTTWNFEGLLDEGAVAAGAFSITDDGTSSYVLNYTCATIPDWTVNPFAATAFNSSATQSTDRFIDLKVTNEKLLAKFQDEEKGLTTGGQFDIFLVFFKTATPDPDALAFRLYQNESATTTYWGRYDLGKFTAEKGPDGTYTSVTDGMSISRIQTLDGGATAKLTLYGIYTDEDDVNKAATVYMVPLQVFNGKYEIDKDNEKLIIAKADITSGTFSAKDMDFKYSDAGVTNNSVWAGLPDKCFYKNTGDNNITNQQLWDKTVGLTSTIGSTRNDIWGTYTDIPEYALYIMTDPAKYKGYRVDRNLVKKNGAYIGKNWYVALLKHYIAAADYETAKAPEMSEANIVWLDEPGATAIFGVKEVKTNEGNSAIYTLQGVRVSQTQKGQIYIQNGKKFIAK